MSGGGMGRVTALMSSVMDLHVRIALQEVGKEKRRVIGGGIFLAMGVGLASMASLALQLALSWGKDGGRLVSEDLGGPGRRPWEGLCS